MKTPQKLPFYITLLGLFLVTGLSACIKPSPTQAVPFQPSSTPARVSLNSTLKASPTRPVPFVLPTRLPGAPKLTSTPDPARILPTIRANTEQYVVKSQDTLGKIASQFGIGLSPVVKANNISNPDIISVGQSLTIPPPQPIGISPAYKIIPDSELVYGPASSNFDVAGFIQKQGGYLYTYKEKLGEQEYSGSDIINFISADFSVNPRLLLTLLEYQSSWVTNPSPDAVTLEYPLRYVVSFRKGLYSQLSWAANSLNRGYYLWKTNAVSHWILADDSVYSASQGINAGTAGVQNLMSQFYGQAEWTNAVGINGLSRTYEKLFGYPFDYSVDPLVPSNIVQPVMQLPFEKDALWSFTGGPHGGWGDGSAWAALDFAPPGEALGCVLSDAWVTAAANGKIVRSGDGIVVIDLDENGYEQTGWIIFYLHIDNKDRISTGTNVKAGDRIGHPSCEGGVSTGTHVHIARRYNGEWISADRNMPFTLGGWVSEGTGVEYDGFMVNNGQKIEAWEGRRTENQIQR
jgi:LasA protease